MSVPSTQTRITDVFVKAVRPQVRRIEIKDTVETGFVLRVSTNGVKTFALKTRDASGRNRTVTLGRYPDLTVKEARSRAQKARLDLKDGKDVNAEKRSRRQHEQTGEQISLAELVLEFERHIRQSRKSWAPRGPRTDRSNARGCIERVFRPLLGKPVEGLTTSELADALNSYTPANPSTYKKTSNGQVSRARAYLIPALDWASGRNSFRKVGSARRKKLSVPDLRDTFDPSSDDPNITGERDRILDERELVAVLPLLKYPAPRLEGIQLPPEKDFRPIAMRFMLMTASRREEVVGMRRRDLFLDKPVWRKSDVKSTRGGPRDQVLPITKELVELLTSLPHFESLGPDDLVFPNSVGGQLGNWSRFNKAIHNASNTWDWHRHDLRRTAASLMHALNVSVSVIDQILGHKNPLKSEEVSASASNYIRLNNRYRHGPDPQVSALEQLAQALDYYEKGKNSSP